MAQGGYNALSVFALAEEVSLLAVPDIYMGKIVVGSDIDPSAIDLDKSPSENLAARYSC